MKTLLSILVIVALCAGAASAGDENDASCLTCKPVNGFIQLPGIGYDDLTPLARETFKANPAAVTNALYSLPYEERDDFIDLYLEPNAREKHRQFFVKCREISERRALAAKIGGNDIIPPQLRRELQERERVRLALHEGAIPFHIAGRILYIPIPFGFSIQETPLPGLTNESVPADSLAVFRKADVPTPGAEPFVRRDIVATVKHVREGTDNLAGMLHAYRIMVDEDWRLTGMYPPDSAPGQAESVEYKWNLKPFGIGDISFCYGQFEKTRDFHGVEEIRYRATAVVMLPGAYIQVSVAKLGNTGLDAVSEINTDLQKWRDAILTAN